MDLTNVGGLAFVGPGSEWFWAATSGLVLAITFIAIYRQLRLQASANAFEQMDRIVHEWASESSLRNMLEILVAVRAGTHPEKFPEGAAAAITDFWESVGSLVRAGHVDPRLVHDFLGDRCQWWWAVLRPWTRHLRLETGDPLRKAHLDWLAGVMSELDRKAGVHITYDEAFIAKRLDAVIESFEDRIRVAEDVRATIVRPAIPTQLPPPAPTAQQQDSLPIEEPARTSRHGDSHAL